MARKSVVSNGLKLKGFRKQNGFTQAEVGAAIGRNHKTISKYECGVANIPNAIVERLNALYGIGLTTTKSTKKVTKTVSKVKSTKKTTKAVKSTKKVAKKVSVGSKFVNWMKSTGLTISKFCNKYNTSPAAMYRVVNGKGSHYLSFKSLSLIAKDIELNKIFG